MKTQRLAIVIPAYKAEFLDRTLRSIADQTDQRFVVYVGDDASPQNIEEICCAYQDLPLVYKKFGRNMGGDSLVKHWERCVDLAAGHSWIWLFSDDDLMASSCVENFYRILSETNGSFDLYRFDTVTIDSNDKVIRINPKHPNVESSFDFAYDRFHRRRDSFAVEYIFSMKAFREASGFVDFPLGWCADDASWVSFGKKTGIKRIPGPVVQWRKSELNISSPNKKFRIEKVKAAIQYIEWFNCYTENLQELHSPAVKKRLLRNQRKWLWNKLKAQSPYTFSELMVLRAIEKDSLTAGLFWKSFWHGKFQNFQENFKHSRP